MNEKKEDKEAWKALAKKSKFGIVITTMNGYKLLRGTVESVIKEYLAINKKDLADTLVFFCDLIDKTTFKFIYSVDLGLMERYRDNPESCIHIFGLLAQLSANDGIIQFKKHKGKWDLKW